MMVFVIGYRGEASCGGIEGQFCCCVAIHFNEDMILVFASNFNVFSRRRADEPQIDDESTAVLMWFLDCFVLGFGDGYSFTNDVTQDWKDLSVYSRT